MIRALLIFIIFSSSSWAKCIAPKTYIPIPKNILKGSTNFQISNKAEYLALHHSDRSYFFKINKNSMDEIKKFRFEHFFVLNTDWDVFADLTEIKKQYQIKLNYLSLKNISNYHFMSTNKFHPYISSTEMPTNNNDSISIAILNADSTIDQYNVFKNKKQAFQKAQFRPNPKKLCSNIINSFNTPTFSKQFEEISHINENKLIILKINEDYSCKQVGHLDFDTGPIDFSYKEYNKLGSISYSAENSVIKNKKLFITNSAYVFNRDKKQIKRISSLNEKVLMKPVFLKNNRLAYIDWVNSKLVITDPNQVDAHGNISKNQSLCIQE